MKYPMQVPNSSRERLAQRHALGLLRQRGGPGSIPGTASGQSSVARLKTIEPLELDGTPGEEPVEPLEQVGPPKQESMGPFGDNGGP